MANAATADVLGGVLALIESTLKVPADQVDIDANLESFGVNSLIVMELMENIEKQFDVTLTPAQFSNIDTVRGLAGLVESLLEPKSAASVATLAPAAVAPLAVSAAGVDPERAVRDFIERTFHARLPERPLGSLDDVADTLLAQHAPAVRRHYGLDDDAAPRAGAQSPLVAIVGLSCRLPDAPDARTFWDNLIARRGSVREIPASRWNWQDHYADAPAQGRTISRWGALLDDVDCFDAGFFGMPPAEAAAVDPQLRLLMQECFHAVEDAGIDMRRLAGSNTGVFVGYEFAEYEQLLRARNNTDVMKGPLFSSSSPSYYLANRISHVFDLHGPSEAFNVNCASSAVAINRAYQSLLAGESDVAIAGAASLNLFPGDYIAASQYGVLSADGSSRVFEDDANGFTRGEGVAAVVLKRLADAERDNDRIYAVIRCSHQNFRGTARNISEVKHESITAALTGCYDKAGVAPESIHYIEVDGYASKWADSFEYEGVKAAFARDASGSKHVALGSMKANIGNVEPVSGVANVIKLALSLHHGRFPPTLIGGRINSFIDIANPAHPLYIADRELPLAELRRDAQEPIRAGVNSFADSGSNVHILLEEYRGSAPAADASALRQLFVLSARDDARLQELVERYIAFLSQGDAEASLSALVYTAQVGRAAFDQRLAIVASSRRELLDKLVQAQKSGLRSAESREIYRGRVDGAAKNPLAALITPDMVRMQLVQNLQSAQWKPIALLWVNGVDVPWDEVWRGRAVQRVSMPTYPFARERHWIDGALPVTAAPAVEPAAPPAATSSAPAEWYFHRDTSVAECVLGRTEKISLFLRQAIALQLGTAIEDVAPDRDFIALGMNSMGVAEVILKTDRLLGTNLSPSVLFKHPDVGSLSDYLADTCADALDALIVSKEPPSTPFDGAAAAPVDTAVATPASVAPEDALIPLQATGARTAIFAVPGAGGSALSLHQLSHALGADQPFYCIEPLGLDGRVAPLTEVEGTARFNIAALKSVQPEGPYRLLGYSNGGVVAFEMARQLSAQGDEVASLALLDSLAPALLAREPIEVMMAAVFRHFVGSLGGSSALDVATLQQIPESERSAYLYAHVSGLGIELPRAQFVATFEVATRSERDCRAYRPAPLPGSVDVVLYRAADAFADAPDDYGWGEFATVRTQPVAADHFTLLEKDAVAELARLINPPVRTARRTAKPRER